MEPIKILMLGGRRCGKTSALASMFYQMTTGPANRFFTINDKTIYKKNVISPRTGDKESQDDLGKKIETLQGFFGEPEYGTFDKRSGIFLVDSDPTNNIWNYKLRFQDPNEGTDIFNRHHFDIDFVDIPGEFCRRFTPHSEYVKAGGMSENEIQKYMEQLVASCDIAMVVIDTPYLMEAEEGIRNAVNCIQYLKGFLSHMTSDKAKMVMFVPIKCEKWIKDGKIEDIYKKLIESYNAIITDLSQPRYSNLNICIAPIQTAGNILFAELTQPLILTKVGSNDPIPCCKIQDGLFRLENGESYVKQDGDDVNPSPFAKIDPDPNHPNEPKGMKRPYSWYNLSPKKKDWFFAPHNCDNMTLHILQFIVAKYSQEGPGTWGKFFGGGITKERMKTILRQIKKAGLINENKDCIKYIQNRFNINI